MGNFEPSKFGLEFSGFVCAGLISAVFELHWPKGPFLCCSMGDVSQTNPLNSNPNLLGSKLPISPAHPNPKPTGTYSGTGRAISAPE
jgi:hypothetical protein